MTLERSPRPVLVAGQADLPLPSGLHPVLRAACTAAADAMERGQRGWGRAELLAAVADGADGTPTSRLDQLVEEAILEAVRPFRVNVLSEECGFLDHGSALTLMMDPVDGTGNAAAGLPLATFTATLVNDGEHQEALTYWFATMQSWHATRHGGAGLRSTGRRHLDGSFISMIRPKGAADAFLTLARRADRARVFGSSSLEAAWVTTGVLDAFVDAGTDTHRSVDLAAALVLAPAAGGAVIDAYGRSLAFSTEITARFSGIVAATEELAEEIAAVVRAAHPRSTT
ncbi:MAG: inositol monophosphatase family protein [Acidimicrobiia bacterium]